MPGLPATKASKVKARAASLEGHSMMILKARTAGSNSHHFLIEGKDDSPERPAPVDPKALAGQGRLSDGAAYSQSKLVLTSWSHSLALSLKDDGPAIIAVNPGSMLGSKMVKEAFGVAGGDIAIGADILCSAALDDEFGTSSGQYFDNDLGRFASPYPDALDPEKSEEIVRVIETVLAQTTYIDQPK